MVGTSLVLCGSYMELQLIYKTSQTGRVFLCVFVRCWLLKDKVSTHMIDGHFLS